MKRKTLFDPVPTTDDRARKVLATLRRFRRPAPVEERCELCSAGLTSNHRHLLETSNARIVCACDPCALRFQDAAGGRFKLIPRQVRFASTHTIFRVQNGEFLSLLDPPAAYREAAATCANVGTWPVLVGEKESGDVDTILSSPIILYDYPQIAPESPGELFDGTEIDEILTLRVLTMTDEEKWEMSQIDEQARKILDRTESLSEEQFIKMHGAMREVSSFNEDFFNPSG